MTPLEIFRVVAEAFGAVDDSTVQTWLDLTAPLVSRKRFGRVWAQALALLTAHRMQLAGVGEDSGEGGGSVIDELGGAAVVSKLASYSSGGESISFYHGGGTGSASADSEFELTEYGVQYLTLQKMYTIPIINAGEARC